MSEHVYCVAVTLKTTERVEQQICIIFCVKIEHCSVETIWMIPKAFRGNARSAEQTKVWHKCFKDDQERDPHSGRPATRRTPENIECVQAAINKDRQLTVDS